MLDKWLGGPLRTYRFIVLSILRFMKGSGHRNLRRLMNLVNKQIMSNSELDNGLSLTPEFDQRPAENQRRGAG